MVDAARRPTLVAPGEGQSVWSLGGRFSIKADAVLADDRYALVEVLAWRSTKPPTHIQHREDEAWSVLDGQMTFRVGNERFIATAGSFVFAPRGLAHGFRNFAPGPTTAAPRFRPSTNPSGGRARRTTLAARFAPFVSLLRLILRRDDHHVALATTGVGKREASGLGARAVAAAARTTARARTTAEAAR